MDRSAIIFNSHQFNRLFPFHFIFDESLQLISTGSSLNKICSIRENQSFNSLFYLIRPEIEDPDFPGLLNLQEQMLILGYTGDKDVILRGQFEYLDYLKAILFMGSPWLGSMDQVSKRKLTLHDFAIHDPMVDLLHVIKTQEIVTSDLKQILNINKKQKEELIKAAKEIHDIALFPMQNPDPLIRIDSAGKILIMNPVASNFKTFIYDEKEFDPERLWEEIALTIDRKNERWSFEAETEGLIYSFVCKYFENEGYFNIYGRDITQDKIKDQNIRLLSLIAEENINAVVICNAEGKIEWVNKSYMGMTGYTLEELIGYKPGPMLQGPESDPETIKYISARIKSGKPFNCEIINYSKTGRKYWIHILGQALFDSFGKITGYFALEEDITKEKEDQNRIKESESRLSTLIGNMQEGILLEDQDRRVIYTNQKFCDLFNIKDSPESMIGDFCTRTTERCKYLIRNSDNFLARIEQIINHREIILNEEIELHDGRYLERDFIPIIVQDQYIGHLWKYSDITERINYQKRLLLQEEKYRNIITNMNLGLIEIDARDEIVFANQSFCLMSGFNLDELKGKKIYEIFDSLVEKNFREEIKKKGLSSFSEIQLKNKEGESRWWLLSTAQNSNEKGILTGIIAISLDITNQKLLEKNLKKARKKAEESSRAKESFLANMSHEIRTPLNAINGMLRELTRESLSPKQYYFLNNAKTASGHLLSIISNILDISKIEAGEFLLDNHHFSLRELIEDTAVIISSGTNEKMLDLEIMISDKIHPVFIGDPTRIKQILINLLGNSVKFTEKGKITLICDCDKIVDGLHLIHISIQDTGIGMDKGYLKNLFSKFSQEDKTIARKYGGTGLGMAITSELIKLMKGTIKVNSEKDKGTKIDIILPLIPGENEKISINKEKEVFNKLIDMKVLLVEDNEINRLVARSAMENHGMTVEEAENGQEAIEKLKRKSFDLILMDLQMPVMDGITATRLIRNKLKNNTPIIALSANAFKKELDLCIKAGMNDYVTKPFEEITLLRCILENTDRGNINGHVASTEERQSGEGEKIYDLRSLLSMVNNNLEKASQIIRIFIENTEADIETIKKAWEEKDFNKIALILHKIKAPVGILKIENLREAINEGEIMAKKDPGNSSLKKLIDKILNLLGETVNQIKNDELFKDNT